MRDNNFRATPLSSAGSKKRHSEFVFGTLQIHTNYDNKDEASFVIKVKDVPLLLSFDPGEKYATVYTNVIGLGVPPEDIDAEVEWSDGGVSINFDVDVDVDVTFDANAFAESLAKKLKVEESSPPLSTEVAGIRPGRIKVVVRGAQPEAVKNYLAANCRRTYYTLKVGAMTMQEVDHNDFANLVITAYKNASYTITSRKTKRVTWSAWHTEVELYAPEWNGVNRSL